MERKRVRSAFLFVLAAVVLNVAVVRADGGYVGVGYGQSTMKDASEALLGTSFDDKDNALKIFGGFQFNKNFAVEMAYIDFGEFIGTATNVSDKWEATGLILSAVGMVPLGDSFSLLGKAGMNFWNVDDNFRVGVLNVSASESGVGFAFGVGAQFAFTKNFAVRAEWEWFTDVGDEDLTGESDLEALSFSALFKF